MQAVVCGGAFSLISDIKKVPRETIKISSNHHAANMLDCEYMVVIETKHAYRQIIEPRTRYLDLKLADITRLRYTGYAGCAAVSFALHRLNAEKVYIAGMDLYQTDYYYSEVKGESNIKKPYEERVSLWRYYRDSLGADANRVIPISGPIKKIWSS